MAHIPALEGADPEFAVPTSVSKQQREILEDAGGASGDVSEEEFQWMEARRPLKATLNSLTLDYGPEGASEMQRDFESAGLSHLLGTLNWPGVGTRWRSFLDWCIKGFTAKGEMPPSPEAALRGYGRSLGRVKTYRALAIDDEALMRIFTADCIFPSGQLRVGSEELERVVNAKGVQTVCVARLFISHLKRLLGNDPSISLHDDWQTTSLIASGYARYSKLDPSSSRKVHLFELSCPKVESIGWTLQEVALRRGCVLEDCDGDPDPWFQFPAPAVPEGIWFDGRFQRTERYGLYGVPFLAARLSQLYVFDSLQEIGEVVMPFAKRQAELHEKDVKGSSAA